MRTEQLLCVYEPKQKLGRACCSVQNRFKPPPPAPPTPVIYYWPFQGDFSVVGYHNCQYSSAFCLSSSDLLFNSLGYSCGHLLEKSCPLGFSFVLFFFFLLLLLLFFVFCCCCFFVFCFVLFVFLFFFFFLLFCLFVFCCFCLFV